MQKTLNSERNVLVFQMLRDTRIAVGLTQAELAAKLDAHQTEVSRVERGIRRLDVLELHDWLAALGVPLLEFVAELDDRLRAMRLRNKHALRRFAK
jgi:transcriptional regulator with XRE-family HTH domain